MCLNTPVVSCRCHYLHWGGEFLKSMCVCVSHVRGEMKYSSQSRLNSQRVWVRPDKTRSRDATTERLRLTNLLLLILCNRSYSYYSLDIWSVGRAAVFLMTADFTLRYFCIVSLLLVGPTWTRRICMWSFVQERSLGMDLQVSLRRAGFVCCAIKVRRETKSISCSVSPYRRSYRCVLCTGLLHLPRHLITSAVDCSCCLTL